MRRTVAAVALLAFVASGCEYQPPPEGGVVAPETGTFFAGDPIELAFTTPIKPESLAVRVWPDVRDIENELPDDAVPLLDRCTLAASPCEGGVELTLSDDRMSATLILPVEGLGKPDVPLLVEILEGLVDDEGATSGRGFLFDVQFKPADARCFVPITDEDGNVPPFDFTAGHYLIVGTTTEPLPTVLTLLTHIAVLPDGRMAITGAEGDEISSEFPRNTRNPEELMVDTTDQGFVIFATGLVRAANGEIFFETCPFEVNLRVGPIVVILAETRITGKIVKDDRGFDFISGTLSFAGVTLDTGSLVTEYEAGSTTFTGDYIPPDVVPEGTPHVCDAPCGAVEQQCTPPEPFPPLPEFCP